jgi:hypothetical protein
MVKSHKVNLAKHLQDFAHSYLYLTMDIKAGDVAPAAAIHAPGGA